jgi:hypothetical protein
MLKICPKCHNLSIEYDPHQKIDRCLNMQCGWVNRKGEEVEPQSFRFSITMEERVKGSLKEQLEAG